MLQDLFQPEPAGRRTIRLLVLAIGWPTFIVGLFLPFDTEWGIPAGFVPLLIFSSVFSAGIQSLLHFWGIMASLFFVMGGCYAILSPIALALVRRFERAAKLRWLACLVLAGWGYVPMVGDQLAKTAFVMLTGGTMIAVAAALTTPPVPDQRRGFEVVLNPKSDQHDPD